MIVNLWSTPRTGSVRYSFYLQQQYPGSLLVSEMFNRYHMSLYYHKVDGKIKNIQKYVDGSYYKKYQVKDGKLVISQCFEPRTLSVEKEENYLIDLFNQLDGSQILIMHNHVSPINLEIRTALTKMSDNNIYIYRRDKRKQLASYVIAYSTKQFVSFNKDNLTHEQVPDIDPDVLRNLINRIIEWDKLEKNGKIIAYEDLQFEDMPKVPVKQNYDHYLRLSKYMKDIIEELVIKYESNQL